MVGFEHPLEVGRHAFSCGDSLPAWAWNLEDKCVRVGSMETVGPAHRGLKGTVLPEPGLSWGSLVTSGVLMNGPRNPGSGLEHRLCC